MTAVAAFKACYTDWKLVRTRSVVQIVLEVPVEKSGEAYDVLGGMPTPGAETWCAIARLNEGGANQETAQSSTEAPKAAEPEPPTDTPAQSLRDDRKGWRDLSYAQQAGIRCSEEAFRKFLHEKIAPDADFDSCTTQAAIELAASIVRTHCIVQSRGDIRPNHPSGRLWRGLDEAFQVWMHHPEFA
jgi:hypothetical protein